MGIVEQMTGVFSEVGEWIVSAITDLQPIFYNAETGLTFMGTLAVVGLAIAVIFLVVKCLPLPLVTMGNKTREKNWNAEMQIRPEVIM